MQKTKAFTLVEVLIVIVIVGILSSFVSFQLIDNINEGKDVKRKADVNLIANAVTSYSSDHYSSKPITDADGCNLNSDCGSTIDDELKAYLPTLPDDPSGTHYVYQSNGIDCAISAYLSDGTIYQYSCNEEQASTGTSTPGVCGSADNKKYDPGTTSFGSDTLCSSGTPDPASPTFPTVDGTTVSWDCPGTFLGDSVSCTAYRGKDGICGSVAKDQASAYTPAITAWPSSDYCASGTVSSAPVFPVEGGSTSWTCPATYAGTDASCIAYRGQNGACGTSSIDPNNNFKLSTDITSPCLVGTVSTITGSGASPYNGYWKWTCSGIYTGSASSQCLADKKVDGACGSAGPYTVLSSGVCSAGVSDGFTGTGPWTWHCDGLHAGDPSGQCTGNYVAPAVCGADDGTVRSTSGYPDAPTPSCLSGTSSGLIGGYSYYYWTCTNTAESSVACTATTPILCYGSHTYKQCFDNGGSWVTNHPSTPDCSTCYGAGIISGWNCYNYNGVYCW